MAVIKGTSNIPTSSSGGGSSQSYEHNIYMKTTPDLNNFPCSEILISIKNTQSTSMDRGQVADYLYNKGFLANQSGYVQRSVFMKANGTYISGASSCCDVYKIAISSDKSYVVLGCHNGNSNITTFNVNVSNFSYLTDTVVES